MNYRTFFWAVAFALPVVFAVAFSIPLQRERAALEAMIARSDVLSLETRSSSNAGKKMPEEIESQKESIEADLKRLESSLSPWQKREIAVMKAAARLAAEGGGSTTAKGSPPILGELSYDPQLLGDPKYASAVSALAKQGVEGKYGRLFAALKLSPADQDQLENLLAERQMARDDAKGLVESDVSSSNAASPDPSIVNAEVNAASSAETKAIGKEIRTTFGLQVSRAVSAYDGIAQFYNVTDEMQTQLSYTPTPLQPSQADQIVGLLTQALGPKVYTSYWTVPNSVITQAATALSPPQIAVLQQIQEEQVSHISTRNQLRATAAVAGNQH